MSEGQRTELIDVPGAREFLRDMPKRARTLGQLLVTNGAVREMQCDEPGRAFTVSVKGPALFAVSVFYADGGWDAECNCRKTFDCEHAYAAMAFLLEGHPEGDGPAPKCVLKQRLIEHLKRKLRPEELRQLKIWQDLYARCRAKGGIESWELAPFNYYTYGHEWGRLELWPSFPEDDYQFWLYIAHAFQERDVPFPPLLSPITRFEGVQERLREMNRQKEVARWQEQLRLLSGHRIPAKRGINRADFRLVLKPGGAHLEWRQADDAEFKGMKPNVAKRFSDEYMAGAAEIVAEAAPLWHALFQPYSYRWSFHHELRYNEPETKRLLNPLLRLATLRERIVTPTGEPVPRPAEPLRWQLVPAETEKDDYQLRLARTDGGQPPPVWLTLPGNPTLYLTKEGLYAGPAADEAGLKTAEINSIPAPALETPEGLDLVQRLGLELPPRLQQRAQRVTLRATILCELKPAYPGATDSEFIYVRVQAAGDNGKACETFTGEGWCTEMKRLGAAPPKKDGTIYLYDRSALDSFPLVLEGLGLKWDAYHRHWRVRMTKKLPQAFVEWLESLPKDIELQLDRELTTLTQAPAEATVKLDCTEAGVDWFDLKVVLNVSDTELTPEEMKVLLDAQGRFVRLGKKGWRRLHFNLSAEEDERLARLGLSPKDFSSEPQRLHALQLADKAAAPLLPERQAEDIQRRVSELKTRVTPPVPETVHAQLRPYQLDGFHFLAYLTANNFGGILADDMGLGKTLQTLTWLAWLRAQPDRAQKPSLVVCPKSVMDTWLGEASRFTPDLRVKLWKGTDPSTFAETLTDTDLLVMNYAQLRGLDAAMANVHWLAAILDEGQYIKNPESQTARVARSLKADYRLALSGTPIENRLLDLWSLVTFAMPGVLGNRAQFIKRFDQAGDPLARRRLTARVRPFLLRRTKSQVATDLPDRTEEDLYCELEGQQKMLYHAEFKRAQQMLLNVQTRKELNEFRFHFLTSLLRLRQICCHPALYSPESKNAESAKLNAFMELVEPLMQEGHKVLVFSQFVTMLDILRGVVQEKQWPHFYLAGDTENRGQLVADFQKTTGPAVFLISLKAGGFGLNLTAASYVVLFDPWWNPAVEAQAIDRTHRIGQTSKVIAYRLLTKGSIEEKIRALQKAKSALVADVLGEDSFAGSLTLEDLHFLFSDEAPAAKQPAVAPA